MSNILKTAERSDYTAIALALRMRICLVDHTVVTTLHEGKIAEEFGVSRTPVRQVLQMLAHQGLVETRPGIGTVVVPLEDGQLARDAQTTISLLRACVLCCVDPVPAPARFGLIGLASHARELCAELAPRNSIVEISSSFHDLLIPLVGDPLLAQAYSSAYWRMIRWRASVFEKNRQFMWERLHGMIDASARACSSKRQGELFNAIADFADESVPQGRKKYAQA